MAFFNFSRKRARVAHKNRPPLFGGDQEFALYLSQVAKQRTLERAAILQASTLDNGIVCIDTYRLLHGKAHKK